MLLVLQVTLHEFNKWDFEFVGPINPPKKCMGACYIITATNYSIRWAKVTLVRDCTTATPVRFLFGHVVIQFRHPKFFLSDQGTHFVNQLIGKLAEEF